MRKRPPRKNVPEYFRSPYEKCVGVVPGISPVLGEGLYRHTFLTGYPMTRKSTMGLVRRGKMKIRGPGFLVSWDVDSRDRRAVNRMQYFLFGRRDRRREGQDPVGFVWRPGVRYIAQSAVFVVRERLAEIEELLLRHGIDFDVDEVTFS